MFFHDVQQTIGSLTENEQILLLQMVQSYKMTREEAGCLTAKF